MEFTGERRKRLISLGESEISKISKRVSSKRKEKSSRKSDENLNETFTMDDETQVEEATPKIKKSRKQRVKWSEVEIDLTTENANTTPKNFTPRKKARILGDMQNMSGVIVVSSTDTPERRLTKKSSVNFKDIPTTPANHFSMSTLRSQTPYQKSSLLTEDLGEEVTSSKRDTNEHASPRKKINSHSTPLEIKKDTASLSQPEIVSPVRRRTFEVDEPTMPENKRKSELFERRILKRKREHLVENSPIRKKMSKSVAFDSVGQIESPWKDVLGASITDDIKLDLKPATVSENGFHQVLSPGRCKSTGSKTPLATSVALKKTVAKSSTKKTSPHKISTRKTKSAVKVPNYAAIHKNAFERMESVADHVQRKAERAKALMSGSKVKIGLDANRDANSRKQLLFATTISSIPIKKIAVRSNLSDSTIQNEVGNMLKVPQSEIGSTPSKKIAVQTNLSDKTIRNEVGNVLKVVQREIKVKSPLKQKLKGASNKTALKEIKKVEIKAVANKIRAAKKDQLEVRRTEIKGVRSNRRFDLLMKMRQNK